VAAIHVWHSRTISDRGPARPPFSVILQGMGRTDPAGAESCPRPTALGCSVDPGGELCLRLPLL